MTCPACKKAVRGGGLGCGSCGTWYHLECYKGEGSATALKKRLEDGWRWFCDQCLPEVDKPKADKSHLEAAKEELNLKMSEMLAKIMKRLDDVESKVSDALEHKDTTPTAPMFANIIKQTLEE